jgi:hypothetical protein
MTASYLSRCLVLLNMRNIFNTVLQECLREIIYGKFPTLEAFADVIYEEPGTTVVQLENGE